MTEPKTNEDLEEDYDEFMANGKYTAGKFSALKFAKYQVAKARQDEREFLKTTHYECNIGHTPPRWRIVCDFCNEERIKQVKQAERKRILDDLKHFMIDIISLHPNKVQYRQYHEGWFDAKKRINEKVIEMGML